MNDLTDIQNACIEAAQEGAGVNTGNIIDAEAVVRYVNGLVDNDETATINRYVTKEQVSRALAKLHTDGIMVRLPRASRGWGLGWDSSCYRLCARVGAVSS